MSTDDSTPTPGHQPAAAASGQGSDSADITALPGGPPWSLDVLADLHAGRYPAELTAQLHRLTADDPWAASVLTALDATVDQLSLLPAPRMPETFALRLDAAIADEHRAAAGAQAAAVGPATGGPGPAIDSGVPRPRQTADENVSVSRRGNQPAEGGQSPPQRRPPSSLGPVLPPLPPGPPPASFGGPPSFRSTPPTGQPTGAAPLRALPPQQAPPSPTATPGPALQVFDGSATGRPAPTAHAISAGSSAPLGLGQPGAPVIQLDAARATRRRWIGGLAAAAAVIVIGSATVASLQHSTGQAAGPAPTASSSSSGNALELDPGRFGDALKQIEGKRPAGPLQEPAIYARCLAANAINPSAVTGVVSATFEGQPAAAIAVAIDPSHSRVVVVGPKCGINGAADQLAAQTVTR